MAILNKINVSGTTYDINDERLTENAGTIETSKNLALNGNFTANSIIENMSNIYSAVLDSIQSQITFSKVYVGCVKTGNKITFAIAGKITRTGEVSTYGEFSDILHYVIPQTVADKLYPYSTTYGYVLATGDLKCFISPEAGGKNVTILWTKPVFNQVGVTLVGLNELTLNQEYYFRADVTFLLSDDLLSE